MPSIAVTGYETFHISALLLNATWNPLVHFEKILNSIFFSHQSGTKCRVGGYYFLMKVQPDHNGLNTVFEIAIEWREWEKIKSMTRKKRISLSWTVRLCLFKFLRENKVWNDEIDLENSLLKAEYKNSGIFCHRLMLCLYGQDSLIIRAAADTFGITISRLVRLAVRLYLDEIESLEAPWDFVFLGTKFLLSIPLVSLDMDFHIQRLLLQPFSREDYWPFVPIPHF